MKRVLSILAGILILSGLTAIDRIDNDRLRVSFDAVSFDALTELFDRLQRDARLRAVDATITARVEPGQVRAELILTP